jgi:hypothetical protein
VASTGGQPPNKGQTIRWTRSNFNQEKIDFLSNLQLSASQDGLSPVTWLRMCEIKNVIFLVLRSGFNRQYDTVQILQASYSGCRRCSDAWNCGNTHRQRHTQEPTDHNCLSHQHSARMSCCWLWQSSFWQ